MFGEHSVILLLIYFNFQGQTPQDLAAMKEAQNNYQKLCRESSNSENRYYTRQFTYVIKKKPISTFCNY